MGDKEDGVSVLVFGHWSYPLMGRGKDRLEEERRLQTGGAGSLSLA